jgi:DNA-binding SARP family transcriptional activator/Tfp pilus assembly protein PilF
VDRVDGCDGIVWWRVLGPLQVRLGEAWAGVSAPKWRALAAALLAEPGEVVSTGRLIGELWGDDPPHSARQLVSGYVLRLRRLIGDPAGRVLVTQPPGYRLAITRAEVDAGRFEELAAEGRRSLAGDDAGRAARLCAEALSLWRGAALADVPAGPLVAAEASRLEELRLETAERRIEAELRCGHAAGLVPELRRLAVAYPLRERFWHQLMRALTGCGRDAEALAAYAQAREVIADQLGADPGQDLQRLHRRLLAGNPPPDDRPGPHVGAAAVPRQLPGGVRHFTGRAAELRRLTELLEEAQAGAVMISAIAGTAGVGKTALAVNWARQVAHRFPDGQLYVNLRGYDPGQPMPPADALAGFLRALGVPGQDIPAELEERAARYRSLLAGRRMLVLLDNAGEVEQVRPLLPGATGCVTVVTSRDTLAGLVARDGAARLEVDLLPSAEAAGLLRALIGERAAADPAATAALAERCCRLPLALRVAAELATARPAASVRDLVAELADQQRRLDLLQAGADPRTAVRAVFSWSCQHLDSGAARAFRLAGLHPGPDLEPYAVAALTGRTPGQAGDVLESLARAHLIQPTGPGRYAMHDLLRDYARELAAAQDGQDGQDGQDAQEGQDGQRAALTRLFDYCLHAAAAAMDVLCPAELHRRPRIRPSVSSVPPLTDPASARAWLDAERASLVTVAAHAAAHGWPGHTTRLATTVFRYLESCAYYPEAITICTCARAAARQTGDRAAEAEALNGLGLIDGQQDRHQQAAGHLRQALALYRQAGDRTGEARVRNNLGLVDGRRGRYQQAAEHHRQALALFRDAGDRTGEARALGNLGVIDRRQGRYPQAAGHHQQALALYRQAGDRAGEAHALTNLGTAEFWQGRYPRAASHLRRALTLHRETSNRAGAARTLASLADVEVRRGRYPRAGENFRRALAIFREIGDQAGEADALNGLGELSLATGQPGPANAQHTAALGLASQIGDASQQARAHHGLGLAHQSAGDPGQARRHWQQALTLYTQIGSPEADQVRSRLAVSPALATLQRNITAQVHGDT